MKTISEKINKYQIRLFINTLVKLPVVYLQQLKPRFDHFARETKKETDCYPNSNVIFMPSASIADGACL